MRGRTVRRSATIRWRSVLLSEVRNAIIDPIKDKDWRIVALKAGADLDVVQLSGAYVRTYVPDDDTYSLNDYVSAPRRRPLRA